MSHSRGIRFCLAVVAMLLTSGAWQAAGAQAFFTYQGQLKRAAGPVNGACDFQFALFDAATDGTQIGTTNALTNVSVDNGLFSVPLDFGLTAFNGAERFLDIAVRCPTGSGSFTTLTPRERLFAVPYALFAPPVARDANGNVVASLGLLNDGGGGVFVYGANGMNNVVLSSLNGNPNNGFAGVYDADGNIQAGMYVDEVGKGQVFASGGKNFVVDYPNEPGMKIQYTSLEGPEAGIYDRGVVKLVRGRATITLHEHFVALANPDSITVQLTPGSLASQGLAFSRIHEGRIDIGELHKGTGSYDVHYIVHALRRGYEGQQPVIADAEFRQRFARRSNTSQPVQRSSAAGGDLRVDAIIEPAAHRAE